MRAQLVERDAMKANSQFRDRMLAMTLVVAFRHAAGDLTVRIWEQECLQSE